MDREAQMSARNLALLPAKDIERLASTAGSHVRLDTDVDSPLDSLTCPVLVCGRATDALSLLPTGSVQTVVTFPSVLVVEGLRRYQPDRSR